MYRSRRVLSLPLATLSVLFVSVFLFGSTVSAQALTEVRPLSQNELIILQQSEQVDQKTTMLLSTSQELQSLEDKKKALAEQLANEKKVIEELKQKIAAKKAAEAAAKAEAARVQAQPVYTASVRAEAPRVVSSGGGLRSGCGDNQYAAYIYGQESGGRVTGMCNPSAVNPGGCTGIGQSCPASKIAHCGTDYGCQNAWFSNYAAQRYGGWAGAYSFHKANGWW